MNYGWAGNNGGKYLVRFENLSKSTVRHLYLTARGGSSGRSCATAPATSRAASTSPTASSRARTSTTPRWVRSSSTRAAARRTRTSNSTSAWPARPTSPTSATPPSSWCRAACASWTRCGPARPAPPTRPCPSSRSRAACAPWTVCSTCSRSVAPPLSARFGGALHPDSTVARRADVRDWLGAACRGCGACSSMLQRSRAPPLTRPPVTEGRPPRARPCGLGPRGDLSGAARPVSGASADAAMGRHLPPGSTTTTPRRTGIASFAHIDDAGRGALRDPSDLLHRASPPSDPTRPEARDPLPLPRIHARHNAPRRPRTLSAGTSAPTPRGTAPRRLSTRSHSTVSARRNALGKCDLTVRHPYVHPIATGTLVARARRFGRDGVRAMTTRRLIGVDPSTAAPIPASARWYSLPEGAQVAAFSGWKRRLVGRTSIAPDPALARA